MILSGSSTLETRTGYFPEKEQVISLTGAEMSILITGGTGFIGARVAIKLATAGHQVVCFDLSPNLERIAEVADKVKVIQGDVALVEDIIDVIEDYNVEKIVHVSRHTGASLQPAKNVYLHQAFRVNALGTNCVFEAARLSGIKRVVFASSVAYHGKQDFFGEKPIKEEDPGYADWPYGATKIINEVMANTYNKAHGMSIIAARFPIAYGPGKLSGRAWVNDMAMLPAVGKPVKVPCRSDEKVCLIYVDDIAEIFQELCQREHLAHQVYTSGGHTRTVEELSNIVKGLIPDARISFDEEAPPLGLPYLFDNSRIRQELGIKLRILKDGLLEVINQSRSKAGLPSISKL
ncbi:NAD-dependent epimerase/dehydratase family protein [Chloroflexota bacterium]